MRFLLDLTSRRTTRLLAASALLVGVGGATMAASSAPAAACSPTVFAQTCTMTGTATVTAGSLGVEAPATQTWAFQLDGTNLQLADTADSSFAVQDATGSGDGWNVTATATQFTVGATTTVLADAGTLVFNGSVASEATGATPGSACVVVATCTLPTPSVVYPVDFTTGAAVTPVSIYNAGLASGLGNIDVGTSSTGNAAAWWVNVPSIAAPGAYASTITLAINSGPTGT
jgi:hypothetical protein